MICHDFPYVFIKLFSCTLSCTNGMFHVVTIILFLFFVTDFVQSVKEMIVIVVVPKPDRATDIVSVLSSSEWSAYLEIGVPHNISLLQ